MCLSPWCFCRDVPAKERLPLSISPKIEKDASFSRKAVACQENLGYNVCKIQDYALFFMEVL
jgi:hypothetical protein